MRPSDSIFARLNKAAIRNASSIEVERTESVNKDVSAALFRVGPLVKTENDFQASLASAFDNSIRAIEGTICSPAEGLVVALVEPVPTSKVFEEASVSDMTVVTANVFRDKDDMIWRKQDVNGEAILVRDANDDLSEILNSRNSVSVTTAAVGVDIIESPVVGHGMCLFDLAHRKMRYCVSLAGEQAYDAETQEVIEVDPRMHVALAVQELSSSTAHEIAAYTQSLVKSGEPLTRANMIKKHIDYMKVLYGRRPEYFNKLVSLLREGFGAHALKA
jgi:hypothetical protein